ncbi:MAG: hypothetical protein WA393_13620 [Nitrososphaeraceae archaeon]
MTIDANSDLNNTDANSTPHFTPLIEPSESSGVKTVGLKFWKKEDLAKKSEDAINNAMKTIQNLH